MDNDYKFICKDCSLESVMEKSEKDWFLSKGFSLPIRCKNCRQAKKARFEQFERGTNDESRSYNYTNEGRKYHV